MFYANYKKPDGKVFSGLYDSFEEFAQDTSSPLTEVFSLIDFHVHGKTYAEKQASLCDTAKRFQYECDGDLYMSELEWICEWFYTKGKRYGLVREFRENAII